MRHAESNVGTRRQVIEGFVPQSPLVRQLGIELRALRPDEAELVPESLSGSTVAISVHFIAAARAEDVLATARVVRRGKSLCFCEVTATGSDGRVVAKGLVTYRFG